MLALNLHMHHENWAAVSVLPTVIGGAFGASDKFLKKTFGHHRWSFVKHTLGAPERMAGISFLFTSVPMIYTSIHDKVFSLFGTGLSCGFGNVTSMLLPPEGEPLRVANAGLPPPAAPNRKIL